MKNFNYEFKPTEKKIEILNRLTNFLVNIGIEAKILVIPVVVNNYSNHLKNILDNSPVDKIHYSLNNYIEGLNDHLSNEKNISDYVIYIITNLTKKDDQDIKNILNSFLVQPIENINNIFGLKKHSIRKKEIENYNKASKIFKTNQSRRFDIEEVDAAEIQWLLNRVFTRGINKKEKIYDWNPIAYDNGSTIIPFSKDIVSLSSGMIDLKPKRALRIEHSDCESWQSFIPLTKIPDSMEFPGCEYIMYSQLMGFPVEVCINILNTSHKRAIRKLDKKRQTIKAQIEHVNKNDMVPEELLLSMEGVDNLESDLKRSSSPLSEISITFCVSGSSKEEMEDRAKILEDYFKDMNFGIERPRSDQSKFFMEFIPGTNRYIKDFDIPIPPVTLAGGIFGSNTELGDNQGMYIGRGGVQYKPIFLDLLYACQLNKPAAVFVEGAQGFGKTFNSNLLVYLHVLNGAKALILDPKGDRKNWEDKLPELSEFITTIEFKSTREDSGKLDPFLIHNNNMNEAGQLAINILTELFDIRSSSKEHIALIEATDRVKISNNPCMESLCIELDNFDENDECFKNAKLLARQIKTLNKPSLSGLLYSKGNQKALNFNNKINILMIQDLTLPGSSAISKNDYTSEEKLGTVLMLAISNFAKNFSQTDNSVKKIVLMDEAWSLIKTKQGEDLFERLARTGRSLNTSCIFIGHSSKDLTTEGIRNAIRYKFVFNLGNREEAPSTLEFLGMDVNEENIEILSSDENGLENGECLFSDVFGRIGRLKFDVVYDHLLNAFKTTPPENRREIV
ncbi:MAG: ATP-binding protein [Clostridiales bacterium]